MMSERLWYYLQGSSQQGPVPESQPVGQVAGLGPTEAAAVQPQGTVHAAPTAQFPGAQVAGIGYPTAPGPASAAYGAQAPAAQGSVAHGTTLAESVQAATGRRKEYDN